MILAVLFPLLFAVGGVLLVSDVFGQAQAVVSARVDAISARLHQTEDTINDVSDRFTALQGIADQVSVAAQSASQTVAATMNDYSAYYNGATVSVGTSSAAIPPAALNVPGMSTARGFIQNLYDMLASLASAIRDVTAINQIPGQFGQAVSEAQGLSADLNALSAAYNPLLVVLLVGFVLWIAVIYVLVVFRWLKQGAQMLMGREP
jgi:hypothetical protein